MRRAMLLAAVSCSLALGGCYHVRYQMKAEAVGPPVTAWNHIFLWGLAGSGSVDVAATCPGGLARLETKRSFGNLLLSLLTIGIYTPNQVTVWCAGRTADRTRTPAVGGLERPTPAPDARRQQ
jgi:hypothetical protein